MADESNGQDKEPLDVYTITTIMIEQMAAIAWSKLGLQPDMMSGKMDKNLDQAKVAIDIVDHLSGVIDSQLDESDKRQMHSLVRDLKMNYVNKRQEEPGG